ncbi:MAG: type II toxin-antitoxin system RelE/ParE family toxin [Bacteroidia bacterium]|nr:type II toxin-antitoxin system RelE/ParE family toxin [Bacteroidia bacterium]
MKSGYKIHWTAHALDELNQTIRYLEENFSDKEIQKLAQKIENTAKLISQNPRLFPKSDKKNVHKVVILKFNTLYYRIKSDYIEILSFFSNRQNPRKRKI